MSKKNVFHATDGIYGVIFNRFGMNVKIDFITEVGQ